MKIALYAAGIAALMASQTTLLEEISIGGIKPDLALIVVCFIGFFRGEAHGAVLGMLLGYLMDLLSGGTWAIHLGYKTLVGFGAGLLGKAMVNATPLFIAGMIALCSMVQGLVFFAAYSFSFEIEGIFFALGHILLPQGLYDGALGLAVFWVLSRKIRIRKNLEQNSFKDELFFLSSGRK